MRTSSSNLLTAKSKQVYCPKNTTSVDGKLCSHYIIVLISKCIHAIQCQCFVNVGFDNNLTICFLCSCFLVNDVAFPTHRPGRWRFAIFLPCLNGGGWGPPRQEFTTLLRPQNKPSSRFHLFAKSFCNPHQPSLSLRLGCFSTGLTAPPATPVKLAKLQLVEKKFNTSLKPLIRNLLMSNLHICESIFEKGRFVITKA